VTTTARSSAGTIAAAIRYLAKMVMTGVSAEISGHSMDIARGQIATEKGIGIDLILRFLQGVPGINKNTVSQQLAMLKSSGDYARIISEVCLAKMVMTGIYRDFTTNTDLLKLQGNLTSDKGLSGL
jgi:hypothetical protein